MNVCVCVGGGGGGGECFSFFLSFFFGGVRDGVGVGGTGENLRSGTQRGKCLSCIKLPDCAGSLSFIVTRTIL